MYAFNYYYSYGHQDYALNLFAIDLQLYKIFKITRVLFFWRTLYVLSVSQKTGPFFI